ncbi:MAG: hypothetical protein RIC95_00815 [Vicingaceae bacterium]
MTLHNSLLRKKTNYEPIYHLAKQVLLVDSKPMSSRTVADAVIDLNHIYMGCLSNIYEIEQSIEANEPDLLFINAKLEGKLDGFQVAKIIKLEYDIPFYFLCNDNDCEAKKWMSELNPDGFIYLNHFTEPIKKQIERVLI